MRRPREVSALGLVFMGIFTKKLLNFVIIFLPCTDESDAGDSVALCDRGLAEYWPSLCKSQLFCTDGLLHACLQTTFLEE